MAIFGEFVGCRFSGAATARCLRPVQKLSFEGKYFFFNCKECEERINQEIKGGLRSLCALW